MQKKMSRNTIIASAALLTAIIIYIGCYAFFSNHFYPGTTIDGVSVSGLTPEEADRKLEAFASAYTLQLKERGAVEEKITGSDIGLGIAAEGGSAALKMEQNRTLFVMALFKGDALKLGAGFTVDEDKLQAAYSKLACVDASKVTEPKNASIVYGANGYEVVKEVYGNKASYDVLYPAIKNAAENGVTELDLEKIKAYVDPALKADSDKVKDALGKLNKCLTARITYNYDGGSTVVSKDKIIDWAELDSELNLVFNQEEMKSFVSGLAEHYNTVGTARTFQTSTGSVIRVGGGDYGWKVSTTKEVAHLMEAIQSGTVEDRTPSYALRGEAKAPNDIGSTYVEINITAQHLWYYKDGSLVAEGNVVTGNVSLGNGTPGGIYMLKYKERNATLKGENYSVPVSYWMPFNNNIGIHDAYWRTEFGGQIYQTNGSHGCVNAPPELAQTIFENISPGIPVVVYY